MAGESKGQGDCYKADDLIFNKSGHLCHDSRFGDIYTEINAKEQWRTKEKNAVETNSLAYKSRVMRRAKDVVCSGYDHEIMMLRRNLCDIRSTTNHLAPTSCRKRSESVEKAKRTLLVPPVDVIPRRCRALPAVTSPSRGTSDTFAWKHLAPLPKSIRVQLPDVNGCTSGTVTHSFPNPNKRLPSIGATPSEPVKAATMKNMSRNRNIVMSLERLYRRRDNWNYDDTPTRRRRVPKATASDRELTRAKFILQSNEHSRKLITTPSPKH
ncbi:hypothetical protein NP493_153g08013 [Ridgeia piscesae]|uniref:Uncharacterized protein n=1 Tax=Ridgeia piscesae TaxID=27915 RepID=A0AAD9P4G1_RIDPI|nr:hypothetical protein NP493_153g08013 [Ridgeia piscesae]